MRVQVKAGKPRLNDKLPLADRGNILNPDMDVRSSWVPKTEEEKNQVRRQMERLLETTHFRNSRRYPAVFRFIVEETLEGRGEFLKERLLGIRVFNRPPDYDTAEDPIARVTIAEIRKRIAQYYHEEAHEDEMRIELMPGRYEPEFFPRRSRVASTPEVPKSSEAVALNLSQEAETPVEIPSAKISRPVRSFARWWVPVVAILLVTAASVLVWRFMTSSPLDQLWGPVLKPHRAITFVLPSHAGQSNVAAEAGILFYSAPSLPQRASSAVPPQAVSGSADHPSFLDRETKLENVVFSDVLAANKISNWIATQRGEQKLRLDHSITLDDLQQGPTILIGGLDNEWTLRALAHLRYRFLGTDQEQYWISDRKDPGNRRWEVDLKKQYPAVKRDYALIARVHDESTGQMQVIVAGIGMSGTAAAGEFMVDPDRLEELRKRVGAGFRDHDFEAVLGTDVVNGIPGSARILAVEVW
jgi:hypothetical protein